MEDVARINALKGMSPKPLIENWNGSLSPGVRQCTKATQEMVQIFLFDRRTQAYKSKQGDKKR